VAFDEGRLKVWPNGVAVEQNKRINGGSTTSTSSLPRNSIANMNNWDRQTYYIILRAKTRCRAKVVRKNFAPKKFY